MLSAFPKAVGKVNVAEMVLIVSLAGVLKKVEIGALKQSSDTDLEIWIICETKDYTMLERAIEIINDYISANQKNVNGVFIKRSQIQANKMPDFIIKFIN